MKLLLKYSEASSKSSVMIVSFCCWCSTFNTSFQKRGGFYQRWNFLSAIKWSATKSKLGSKLAENAIPRPLWVYFSFTSYLDQPSFRSFLVQAYFRKAKGMSTGHHRCGPRHRMKIERMEHLESSMRSIFMRCLESTACGFTPLYSNTELQYNPGEGEHRPSHNPVLPFLRAISAAPWVRVYSVQTMPWPIYTVFSFQLMYGLY